MIKRILITITMSFSFFGLLGQTDKFKTVDVAEFAKAVADTSYIVLDVRTSEEHAQGHIPGTDFNIDVLQDNYTETALKTLPKDKAVALYCRSGNRSKNAARILAEKGYQVLELGTGFRGWVAAGKDTTKL
jgi:rhodanese-related sulfurtransferase